MSNPHAYDWRADQPDEANVLLPDGRVLQPLNLGAVLPKAPINPLARLIVSSRPMTKLKLPDGTLTDLEVEEAPLPLKALAFIRETKVKWATKQLRARGIL